MPLLPVPAAGWPFVTVIGGDVLEAGGVLSAPPLVVAAKN